MWHPQARGLAQLHGEGKVTVFPAIGYDPPDESHFTSRHYWEVGELNAETRSGWMGRYLDVAGHADNPLQGLSLDYSLAPALATARVPVAAGVLPSDYTFWAYGLDEPLMAPDARNVRPARLRSRLHSPASPRRVPPHSTRTSSATRSRRSPNTKANRASPRR